MVSSREVVKKRKPKKSRQAQRDGKSQYAEKLSSDRCSLEAGEQPLQRERVSGARRIWGTLRSTTVAAVTTALSRLTMVGGKLQVRRKYKQSTWNILKWRREKLRERTQRQTQLYAPSARRPLSTVAERVRTQYFVKVPARRGCIDVAQG